MWPSLADLRSVEAADVLSVVEVLRSAASLSGLWNRLGGSSEAVLDEREAALDERGRSESTASSGRQVVTARRRAEKGCISRAKRDVSPDIVWLMVTPDRVRAELRLRATATSIHPP